MEIWEQIEQEFKCNHRMATPVRYVKSNGAVCVRIQCMMCGESQGEKRKADYDINSLQDWNEKVRERRRTQRSKRRQELYEQERKRIAEERQEESAEWWSNYTAYLRSPEWHRVRQAVLQRDNHTCQACLRNKATHAHHLSYSLYNQLGRSAAFELVAICRTCHEAIHPHMSQAQDDLTYHSPHLEMARRIAA